MSEYTKIQGLGTGRGGFQVALRSRLYAGADHLLIVQSTGYTEDYRRIFYDNIRYVVARKNNRQQFIGFIAASFFLLVSLLYLSPLPWYLTAGFSLPFVLWFGINLALGPTCSCYINTDIQTLELPTPRRLSKYPRLIDFLKTKISNPVATTQAGA